MSGHQHTDQCDHGAVTSYAERGRALWQERVYGHGWTCRCICCADYRRALGQPMRPSITAGLTREERSA